MKIRKAWNGDLPQLKVMFDKIVENMRNNGLYIWNENYPYEEFSNDIKQGHLYVITDEDTIVATLCLNNSEESQDSFNWENPSARALYLTRIGVNVDYLRKGVGSLVIKYARFYAKESGIEYLRLVTVNNNIPAINLYQKNGFKRVEGEYTFYSELLKQSLTEFGFELKL